MKAKKALGMALALASALFLVACSNMDSGSYDNGADARYSGNRTFNIVVDGVDLSDGSGTAVYDPWINRTVLPEEAYALDASNTTLTLVLKAISNGKKETYHILTAGQVDTPASGQTQFSLTLPAASYDFWLYAYKTADITAASIVVSNPETAGKNIVDGSEINGGNKITTVYWAHGAQDLTNGAATGINFTLSPVDLTGSGTINVGGAFYDPDGIVSSIHIGVYNIYTNELIKGGNPAALLEKKYTYTPTRTTTAPNYFGSTNSPTGANIANKDPGDHSTHIVPETAAAVFKAAAGSYRLAVTFYSDTSYTKEVGYWSDIVIVEPTNKSNSLDIEFHGINTRPASPTGLTASLVEGSYKKSGQVNGKYDVLLEWDDNSSNEKGFLIRVTPYEINFGSSTETPGTPIILGFSPAASDVEANEVKALTDPALGFYTQTATPTANLLLSQCTSVTLTLDTGKLYDFEIVAYNTIGYSEYVPDYGGTPVTDNAVKDNFTTTAGDEYYDNFLSDPKGKWAPRRMTGTDKSGASPAGSDFSSDDTANFAAGKMLYKQAAKVEAVDPTFSAAIDTSAVTEPAAGTTYYYSTDSGSTYNIAYVTKWATTPVGITYHTVTAAGNPYIKYRVNLYTIEYNLSGGKLYDNDGTNHTVSIGSHYAFFRYGNDTPTLDTFSRAAATTTTTLNGTAFLNRITAASTGNPSPTSSGTLSTSEPFLIKWNTSGTAFSNWLAWYRQSQTIDGTTTYYKSPKVPADVIQDFSLAAYGNQVVYASYAGNESPLTIVVSINSAQSGANDIKTANLTALSVADDGTTTGTAVNKEQDDTTTVDTSTEPFLYLKLDNSVAPKYTAVKYYINRVEQSNVSSDGCWVDLTDPGLGNNILVLVAGYIDGAWYGRSFNVELAQ